MTEVPPPRLAVPRGPERPFDDEGRVRGDAWDGAAVASPFVLSHGAGPAVQQTEARVFWTPEALCIRFECEDREPWGTLTRRDDPLWQEEVVEVFLAPGEEDPRRYFEFEVSPAGVLFDAVIHNPHARRSDMEIVTAWDCAGIRWHAAPRRGGWSAGLVLPWVSMTEGPLPRVWRGNLYRIDRPRGGEPEFSCWSPTLVSPPEFHRPSRFGVLDLLG
jgi:hypothetical protein